MAWFQLANNGCRTNIIIAQGFPKEKSELVRLLSQPKRVCHTKLMAWVLSPEPTVEGETWPPKAVLWPPHTSRSLHTCACTHIQIVNKIILIKILQKKPPEAKIFYGRQDGCFLLNVRQMVSCAVLVPGIPSRLQLLYNSQSLRSLAERVVSILCWTSIH